MIVQENQHNSPFEEFYDEAITRDPFKKRIRTLWRAVIGLVILCGLWMAGLGLSEDTTKVSFMLVFYIVLLLVCFISAALLAIVIAIIPIKKYDYGDRIYLILPILLIATGLAGFGGLLLVSLGLFV